MTTASSQRPSPIFISFLKMPIQKRRKYNINNTTRTTRRRRITNPFFVYLFLQYIFLLVQQPLIFIIQQQPDNIHTAGSVVVDYHCPIGMIVVVEAVTTITLKSKSTTTTTSAFIVGEEKKMNGFRRNLHSTTTNPIVVQKTGLYYFGIPNEKHRTTTLPLTTTTTTLFAMKKKNKKNQSPTNDSKRKGMIQKHNSGTSTTTTTMEPIIGSSNHNHKDDTNHNQKQQPTLKSFSSIYDTLESRMEYIQSRIHSIDLKPLLPKRSMEVNDPNPDNNNNNKNDDHSCFLVVDHFLGSECIHQLRTEAERFVPQSMVPSQSSRYDPMTQTMIEYQKKNVLATQIMGGTPEQYELSPTLIEYIVTMTSSLSQRINDEIRQKNSVSSSSLDDEYLLSTKQQTNKLAVCLGDGSYYEKHIDNAGGMDIRKLTAILYLQYPSGQQESNTSTLQQEQQQEQQQINLPITRYITESRVKNGTTSTDGIFMKSYRNKDGMNDLKNDIIDDDMDCNHNNWGKGGFFRAYDVPVQDTITYIEPRSDRFVLFWSDTLVHDVTPSYVPPPFEQHVVSPVVDGTTTTSIPNVHRYDDNNNNNKMDWRWALTIWFVSDIENGGQIQTTDPDVQQRHFSGL